MKLSDRIASRCVVVRTGTANIASVCAALARAGVEPVVDDDARLIEAAPLVVLPGVGSFGAARASLDEHGLVPVLRERVLAGRPTLGICLGFQLLFESSTESPGVPGLGVCHATVERYAAVDGVRVPQMGWNRVDAPTGCRVLRSGWAYFANAYRVRTDAMPREGWLTANATHGEQFVAAIEAFNGRVVACQGHPELSGAWGRGVLERWVAAARAEVPTC
ncbi:MAG: imidazole glycerol phosphate synthase subunit HisH [Phycisphaerales bacterium]|nr:MAG: imidazole glycerol phosphate synthase subunit HisH [Phycisphaerales bacterium]